MRRSFGLYVRQLRQMRNLSVSRLAYEVGCDDRMIEGIETNLRPIPGNILIPYANALHTSPEELILVWINNQVAKMCADANITPLFKVVAATQDDFVEEQRSF